MIWYGKKNLNDVLEEDIQEDAAVEISEEKKKDLKAEFTRIMKERFLSGEDKQFDYR